MNEQDELKNVIRKFAGPDSRHDIRPSLRDSLSDCPHELLKSTSNIFIFIRQMAVPMQRVDYFTPSITRHLGICVDLVGGSRG